MIDFNKYFFSEKGTAREALQLINKINRIVKIIVVALGKIILYKYEAFRKKLFKF